MARNNNQFLPYNITLDCSFAEFWRYNLIVHGEVSALGKSQNIVKHVDEVAPVGTNLPAMPATYHRPTTISIEAGAGDSLRLYIYLLPHTLPSVERIPDAEPFELVVTITQGERLCYKHRYMINQWSGDNIEIFA